MAKYVNAKPRHLESKLQQACVSWFNIQYPKETIFAIPNGGKRNALEAKIMKGEGVLAGVSDLFIMKPSKNYSGFFIEMKIGKGKLSEYQKEFLKKAQNKGYKTAVCYSLDDFTKEVNNYMK
ncbi:VRR-NUC domain-containing protein [Apibacter muscae]|uniref:VRR-NUC domain-containing protein n=1 Tax=Apibacter muscae TaxID=2509004 RepID=UPI0011ACC3A2|nr:VRR-NUC domain-containing protein [Apibacter muscae]TWP31903.1 VRR-NUC domain-containing protein [Apibacter muscae]